MSTPLALATPEELTWKNRAICKILELLLAEGKPSISADDLHGIGEPTHPNQWGTIFKAKELRGIITQASYTTSRRPQRKRGVIRTWKLRPGATAAAHQVWDTHLKQIQAALEAEAAIEKSAA